MPRDRYYKPGSWYRICDISGHKVRAENTRKEWNGLIVRSDFYEDRQPQDFVRGVRDDQTVTDPRPRQPDVFVWLSTYVTAPAAVGSRTISVASGVGFSFGMPIQVALDDGSTWSTYVSSATGSSITFLFSLPQSLSGAFENQVLSLGAVVLPPPFQTDDQGNLITDDNGNPIRIA